MIEIFILILVLLQLKHWYIDFVNQSNEEVQGKGIYGNLTGMQHSLKHGVATCLILCVTTGWIYIGYAILLGIYDFITHYHIDWIKMNYGNRDIQTPAFWNHLGLDQMAHQLIYLSIGFMAVS